MLANTGPVRGRNNVPIILPVMNRAVDVTRIEIIRNGSWGWKDGNVPYFVLFLIPAEQLLALASICFHPAAARAVTQYTAAVSCAGG